MLAVRTALAAFRRAPLLSVLSVTTIAFSLFAFGLFGLVALNIRQALLHVEERVEIRAFAADKTPTERLVALATEMETFREVQKVDVVTQDQALERARRELGEFNDVFDSEFLPASLDVRLKPGFRDPATVRQVVERIRTLDAVDDVRFGEDWLTQLYRIRNIAGLAGLVLGAAFAAVAMIIIGATIRMAVMARAREISIMQLVGATDGYIRRPFLIEGALKGLAGGVLALGMSWAAIQLVQRYLNFKTVFFDARMALLGVGCGLLIGLIGSALSVGRHLRAGA